MLSYLPALDGVRGLLLFPVLGYHFGVFDAGLLAMSVFFALSGYLITAILLVSLRDKGAIDLRTFWLRRARRLLPALYSMLAVVLVTTALARPDQLHARLRQTIAAVLYVANWHTIARGDTYFRRFSGPEPLDHLWSLAVEEQFYFTWPVLVVAVVWLVRRSSIRVERALLVVAALLAVASSLAMALLFRVHAGDHTRVYEGTDTRAAPILVGAMTALLLPPATLVTLGKRARVGLDVLGAIGGAIVVAIVSTIDEHSPFLYRGGEVVTAVASCLLVLAAAHPGTLLRRVLALEPLRWLGERSYAIYLWHMPLLVLAPADGPLARTPVRAAVLFVATVVVGALSYTFLEDPVRKKGVAATFFARGERGVLVRRWAGALVFVGVAQGLLLAAARKSAAQPATVDFAAIAVDPSPPTVVATAAPSVSAALAKAESPTLSDCPAVVHVGDSTSLGLISAQYIPGAEDRLAGRYHAAGVGTVIQEISGGRSIVEKVNDQPSAYEVVVKHAGFAGCWVYALGNGDAANVKGDEAALAQRIDWMVKAAHGGRVLFTTVKTLLTNGSFKDEYMQRWNKTVTAACARHPKIRVFDWAAEVQDDWYLADKVHPNNPGSKERAARIARALAVAFPKGRPANPECVVRSGL